MVATGELQRELFLRAHNRKMIKTPGCFFVAVCPRLFVPEKFVTAKASLRFPTLTLIDYSVPLFQRLHGQGYFMERTLFSLLQNGYISSKMLQ